MKKIYLVDVSSMFFRAFYAVRPLTSPSGQPVNAVYGFLSMMVKILQEEKPEYMAFCYDRKDPSFRKELFENYKANRTEMPEDLALQIPMIKRLADLLGITGIEAPTFEADDIIGTLAHVGDRNQMQVLIVSGDKDFGQLINSNIVLWDTMKNIKYDPAGVKEKWGVTPEQFIDYLAIVGDTSDNIPGVTGVGPKGALKLLEQFKNLEEIYEKVDQVESKSLREKLVNCKEQALLSKKLVTIVTDVPVSHEIESYRVQPFMKEELKTFLQELNFRSFEKKLFPEDFQGTEGAIYDGGTFAPQGNQVSAGGFVEKEAPFSLKIDHDLGFQVKNKLCISVAELDAAIPPNSLVFGFSHEGQIYLGYNETLIEIKDSEFMQLGDWSDDRMIRWKGYDLKSFWHLIQSKHPLCEFDSMLAAYVLKAGDCSDFKKVFKQVMMEELSDLTTAETLYEKLLQLELNLRKQIEEKNFSSVLNQLELPLAPVLYSMERKGIRIDESFLSTQSKELESDLKVLETKIHEQAGEVFNIASPKQLGVILFEKLGLPTQKKTKTGYSTDTDVLQSLDHPIGALVLEYRELAKLKSTYVDSLPQLMTADHRVHSHFNQALTSTGRLSSTEPNLQNIPIRTERGKKIRQAFIASPGMKLLSLDYSQIELRILAHISGDPALCKAFSEDLDIHAATAAEIYNIPLSDVTSDLRRAAKAVNFGIAYGQGAFGLAENLGIGRKEAQEIIDKYFLKFKNVKEYIHTTIEQAHDKGYVETLFGRRRYIDELKSSNNMLKKFGERAAINAPIQGTASDLVKKAMIEIFQRVDLSMLLQVHDELIFEGDEALLKENIPFLVKIMEGCVKLNVPLKVNYSFGNNWDEAH